MDTLDKYRQIIQKIISEYADIPYSYGEIQSYVVFDSKRDRYLLMDVGWQQERYVNSCIIHVQIIDGKIWIFWDGIEDGMANELLEAGIPPEKIVLGFKPPEIRHLTGLAVS